MNFIRVLHNFPFYFHSVQRSAKKTIAKSKRMFHFWHRKFWLCLRVRKYSTTVSRTNRWPLFTRVRLHRRRLSMKRNAFVMQTLRRNYWNVSKVTVSYRKFLSIPKSKFIWKNNFNISTNHHIYWIDLKIILNFESKIWNLKKKRKFSPDSINFWIF